MTKVTGWDNGLSQDYDKGLGRWFANRLGARQQLRQDLEMTQLLIDRATLEQLVGALETGRWNTRALAGWAPYESNKDYHDDNDKINAALTAGRAALEQQELPQKERPDFMAGYDAGMADAKRMAQQGEQPVCHGCGIPAGDVHMSTCKSGKWPSRVSNGDTAAPAPQAQEPARNVTKEEDAILRGALLRSGTVIHPKPTPQPAQDALQDIAAYIGVGGYNGATTEQLSERIRVEFDRLAALQSAQPVAQPRDLTDEEILSLEKQTPAMNDAGEEWIYFARAVLKKARE